MIKGNISRYTYYIIRLSSRRGIKVEKPIRDIKTEHIRNRFDDILYGKVFPKLKWGEGCTCKYYLEWLNRNEKYSKNMTGHTLVYFGAGWDFEPVVDRMYEKFTNFIFIDSLPDLPHYMPDTYGYKKCKDIEELSSSL